MLDVARSDSLGIGAEQDPDRLCIPVLLPSFWGFEIGALGRLTMQPVADDSSSARSSELRASPRHRPDRRPSESIASVRTHGGPATPPDESGCPCAVPQTAGIIRHLTEESAPPSAVIESNDADVASELRALAADAPGLVTLVESKSFSATSYSLQAIVPLVPTAASVVALVATWIRAKRHVEISVGGIKIKGVSANEAERLLNKVIELGDVDRALEALENARAQDSSRHPE